MRRINPEAPRVTFVRTVEHKRPRLIQQIAEPALWNYMKRAEEREDYTTAILYRDELVRRKKLVAAV